MFNSITNNNNRFLSTLIVIASCLLVIFATLVVVDGKLSLFSSDYGSSLNGVYANFAPMIPSDALAFAPIFLAIYLLLRARSMAIKSASVWAILIVFILYWYFAVDLYLQNPIDIGHANVPILKYMLSLVYQDRSFAMLYLPFMGFPIISLYQIPILPFLLLIPIKKLQKNSGARLEPFMVLTIGITLMVSIGLLLFAYIQAGLFKGDYFILTLVQSVVYVALSFWLIYLIFPRRSEFPTETVAH